jgi:hypothetical protein
MRWLKRGTLFILSILFFLSCDQSQVNENSVTFDVVQNIDSVFSLAHSWTEKAPPIPNKLLDSLDNHLDSIKIHQFSDSPEPNAITFSAKNKQQFDVFEKTPTLQGLNKVSYQSYTVWRSVIENKEILEFSLQPHPTLYWTFTIRKRGQE